MATPYIASIVFVAGVMLLCFLRPNAGRIFLGLFYLVMALGVNGMFILTAPEGYAGYASGSYWPLYRDAALWVIGLLTPVVFGLLLVAYELTLAVLLLGRGRSVKIGLAGVIIFIVGIAPLSALQLPWLGLALAAAYLLRKDYPRSLPDLLARRSASARPAA